MLQYKKLLSNSNFLNVYFILYFIIIFKALGHRYNKNSNHFWFFTHLFITYFIMTHAFGSDREP